MQLVKWELCNMSKRRITMADNKEKQANCPICGYTDSAMDPQAFEDAMAEHMRMQHNQTASVNPADSDLKETGRGDTWNTAVFPAVPGAPGNNIGGNQTP